MLLLVRFAVFAALLGAADVAVAKDTGGGRSKYLKSAEKRVKANKTKVDFEAAEIGGARKTPLGQMINQNNAEKDYDFVRIRRNWHNQMVESVGQSM